MSESERQTDEEIRARHASSRALLRAALATIQAHREACRAYAETFGDGESVPVKALLHWAETLRFAHAAVLRVEALDGLLEAARLWRSYVADDGGEAVRRATALVEAVDAVVEGS